ncbi:MAG: Non-canonical purine NTP pyrophosphatase [Candidatus Levybacteria bacterium GW2011_GWB1_35_5]|nr:MAG: Non-canonical purine NTP pyrophosphatase [Candidatus Levybacteria bacterium GW2011_GWB1_35_5]
MKKIFVATQNKGKVGEISDILQIPLEFADIEIDEVQSMDLEYVARQKAKEAFKILKKPVIVDDVGVYIEAWNSFPGPFVKYAHNLLGNTKILDLLKNEKNRKVIVQSAVAYHDGRKIHTFIGTVKGTLSFEEKGKEGWGFDPIIIPYGEKLTFGEMGIKRKNQVSHRAKALDKFKKFLDSQKQKKEI